MKNQKTSRAGKKSGVYHFNLQQLLVVALAIPLLVFSACHRSTPTADSPVVFGKLVMASDVDAKNAPTALADTFSPSQKTIYLVAEAKEIAPGTRLAASWTRDGTPVQVSDGMVATQGYYNTNIEFHLNAGVDGFTPGKYQAQLLVNDKPGPTANFTVK